MPKGKRIPEATKFEVLSCVYSYLPPRAQARFKAVSSTVNKMGDACPEPSYSSIIDRHYELLRHGAKEVITAPTDVYVEHPLLQGRVYSVHSTPTFISISSKMNKGKVDISVCSDFKTVKVASCARRNFKFIFYRALQNEKKLKNLGCSLRKVMRKVGQWKANFHTTRM